MLALSVMQVGIFAAVPLVADREKVILKRLSATPLASLAAGRLQHPDAAADRLIQTVIIVGGRQPLFGVRGRGSPLLAAAFVTLGAVSFLALGYVLASFTRTEDSANGITRSSSSR